MRASSLRCAIVLLCLRCLVSQPSDGAVATPVDKSDTAVDPAAAKLGDQLVAAVAQVVRSELANQSSSAQAKPPNSKQSSGFKPTSPLLTKLTKDLSEPECSITRCYPADHSKCAKFACSVITGTQQPAISAGGMTSLTQHSGASVKASRKFAMRFNFKIVGADMKWLWGDGTTSVTMVYNPSCRCMVVEVWARDNRGQSRLFRVLTDPVLASRRWYTAVVVVDLDEANIISIYVDGARQALNKNAGLTEFNKGVKLTRFWRPGAKDIQGNKWRIRTNHGNPRSGVIIENWRHYDNLGALKRLIAPPQHRIDSRNGCKMPLMFVLINPKTRVGWCTSPGVVPQNYCYAAEGANVCTKTSLVPSFGYFYGAMISKARRHRRRYARSVQTGIGMEYKAVLMLLKRTMCSKTVKGTKCSVIKKVECFVYLVQGHRYKLDLNRFGWWMRFGRPDQKYQAYAMLTAGIKNGATQKCSDFKLSSKRIRDGKLAAFTPTDMKNGWLRDAVEFTKTA